MELVAEFFAFLGIDLVYYALGRAIFGKDFSDLNPDIPTWKKVIVYLVSIVLGMAILSGIYFLISAIF